MDPPLTPLDSDDHVSPVTVAAGSPSPSIKRRRTASSLMECCRTCRLRKVKCTGNPGNAPCTNCARLDLVCSFTTSDAQWEQSDKVSRTTPSQSHTEAGTLRKRAQRACRQCHAHKTKCSGDLPRCKRCDAANLPCEYTPAKRKFANLPVKTSGGPEDAALVAPAAVKSVDVLSPSSSAAGATGNFPLSVDISSLTAE
jgi:hypothetical protein